MRGARFLFFSFYFCLYVHLSLCSTRLFPVKTAKHITQLFTTHYSSSLTRKLVAKWRLGVYRQWTDEVRTLTTLDSLSWLLFTFTCCTFVAMTSICYVFPAVISCRRLAPSAGHLRATPGIGRRQLACARYIQQQQQQPTAKMLGEIAITLKWVGCMSTLQRIWTTGRGHDYKLYLTTCKSNIRSNSFNYRVIQKWNSLPSSIDFTSLKIFRKSLASELLLA